MHSLLELKLALVVPSLVMAGLWVLFFTRYIVDKRRTSAWLSLVFTFFSVIAALWAVIDLNELQNRSLMDTAYEDRAIAVAALGFLSALVWIVRHRNLCTVGVMLTAVWLFWVFSLSYPF